MIRVILIGPNSRLIASIINTVTSTYIVDTTYNGLLCVDSSSIPTSVSDTDLYALWHYTTSNVWATHSASPGTYYKWISEEGASQYTWVYTEPNPVVSIISTISDFQSVTLYWNVTDSNWTDVTFSVELSKISDFSTTIDISYSGSYTDSNSTSNARTYYLRAIWLDDLNVTHYGAVVNTGSITPNKIASPDLSANSVTSFNRKVLSGWSTAGLTINTISGYTIPYYLDTLTLTTEVDSKLLFMLELQNYISSGTTEIGLGINKQSTIDSYGFFDFNQAALPTTATIGNTWYPSANVIASFNSATAVNLATNTITTSSASFVTGQMVQYLPDPIVGGTPIGGLTFGTFSYKLGLDIGTPYYIIKLSDTSYRLASTYLNAMAVTPIPIDLTTLGTGTHSLVSVQTVGKPYIADYSMKFSCNGTSSGVNISTSTFTVTPSANSTLYTGQKIHYYGGLTDIDISPLVAGTDYYVVKLSSTTFKLATTYANAVAATPIVINITAVSTGTHLFQSDLNWYYDSASVETTDIQYITANTNQNTSTLIEYLTQSGGITESYNFYLFLNNPTKLSNLAFTTSFTILNGKR